MNITSQMGQAERLAKIAIAALLSLAGILVAVIRGTNADWEPVAQLLTELATAGGAGIAVRWAVDEIKKHFPMMSPLSRLWVAMALCAIVGPGAYLLLVLMGWAVLTEQGVVIVATAAFATATAIHKEMEAKKEQPTVSSAPPV